MASVNGSGMRNEELLQALSFLNLAVAAGVGVLVALLLLQRLDRSLKFLIGVFYALAGYSLAICWLARSGLIDSTPFLLYTNFIAAFALGPVIYIYTARLLNRAVSARSIALMFLPVLLMLFVVAAYHVGFPQSATIALGRRSPFPNRSEPLMYVASAIAEFSFIAYFLVAGLRVRAAAQLSAPGRAEVLRRFFILYLVGASTYLAVFAGHLLDDQVVTMVASTVNGFSILAYFLYVHKCPGITLRPPRAAALALPLDIREAGPRMMDVAARLERLMTEEKIYRESELTLPSLSATLGISTNQLSKVLNDALGVGFRVYVNSRRLEEAKELLIRDSRSSILDIAFSVGFSSKTTFNTLFARNTGMSPKQYRCTFGNAVAK
jgi:AraC-like DNA-binding protein